MYVLGRLHLRMSTRDHRGQKSSDVTREALSRTLFPLSSAPDSFSFYGLVYRPWKIKRNGGNDKAEEEAEADR